MSLLAEFDPAIGITLNGGDVSDWDGGNSNIVSQSSAILQPAFVADGHLGHPGVQGFGTEFLMAANGSILDIPTSDITIVTVSVPAATLGGRFLGKTFNTAGSSPGYQHFTQASGKISTKYADGSSRRAVDSTDGAAVIGSLLIAQSQFGFPGNRDLHIDGSLDNFASQDQGGVLVSLTTTAKFGIFAVDNLGNPRFSGTYLLIRIYDSAEDMDAIFTELNDRFSTSASPPIINIPQSNQSSSLIKSGALIPPSSSPNDMNIIKTSKTFYFESSVIQTAFVILKAGNVPLVITSIVLSSEVGNGITLSTDKNGDYKKTLLNPRKKQSLGKGNNSILTLEPNESLLLTTTVDGFFSMTLSVME